MRTYIQILILILATGIINTLNAQSDKRDSTNTIKSLITTERGSKLDTSNLANLTSNHSANPSIDSDENGFNFEEWKMGFISGVLATLLGFILTMAWDILKNYRDRIEKDKIILLLIRDTLAENIGYINNIRQTLNQELTVLHEKKSVVTNITVLKNEYWDIIKFNIPKILLRKPSLLKQLQDISSLSKTINESIHSRETYRLNNSAMSNFHVRLKYYDELIVQELSKLDPLIKNFIDELKK